MKKHTRAFNNTTLIKTIEEIDENVAIEMISNPNLDGTELSEVLNSHFCKTIKNKNTNESLQLSNKVVLAGLFNRLNQLANSNI